jgi:protein SDA1
MDLSRLQHQIKEDPAAYKEEFFLQYRHFMSQLQIFKLKPNNDNKNFIRLIKFLSNIAACYPKEMQEFPKHLCDLLEEHNTALDPELRYSVAQSLILLRNRNLLSPLSLLPLFFRLFRVPDKKLRELLHGHIINDIKRLNMKKKDEKTNKTLQNYMYQMLQDPNRTAARKSLEVIIELYRRGIWRDAKTVNVISTGVFSKDTSVVAAAVNFFLRNKNENDSDNESDSESESHLSKAEIYRKYGALYSKKTKKKKKKLLAALAKYKQQKKKEIEDQFNEKKSYNFTAVSWITDPQGYAEKVFGVLKRLNGGFELRVLLMNFISRIISCHRLILEQFYSYLQNYLTPHQQNITQILAITAQSCHSLIPPDILEPLVKTIADQFVSDRRPNEVVAIGINTIREICVRAPLVMNETLLSDLVQYRFKKDKSVVMAARSLITLFRIINPTLLPKKERGKGTDLSVKPKEFGAEEIKTNIDGIELLEKYQEYGSENSEETVTHENDDSIEEDHQTESKSDLVEEIRETCDKQSNTPSNESYQQNNNNNINNNDNREKVNNRNGTENIIESKSSLNYSGEAFDDNDSANENNISLSESGERPNRENSTKDLSITDEKSSCSEVVSQTPSQLSSLAATKILTEEDWELLRSLQEKQKARQLLQVAKLSNRKRKREL